MKIYKYITLIAFVSVFTSCNDFLEEAPNKTTSVVPKTIEHLEALLNNYNSFASEKANEIAFGTDDYGLITELYDNLPSAYSPSVTQYATWDKDYLNNADRPYWPEEWKKIFTANLILQNIDNVSGDNNEKEKLRAEAHFVRAYSFFKLATIFCLPYTNANAAELGLPLKETTSFEEPLGRASLEETYAFIEADLNKALELKRSFDVINGQNRTWRASTVAVHAFAARYYLALNNYVKAQEYAEMALNEYNWLRDYNTEMSFSTIPTQVTILNPDAQVVDIHYPYTHDNQDIPTDKLEWGESYYYRFLRQGTWAYWPSQDLLNLYDSTYDLRYKYHIVEDYSYERGAVDPPYSYPGYIFFFKSDILSGPSVPEMILTKAECQIRQGLWAEGLTTVNSLRASRIDVNAPPEAINLSAVSQEEALSKVLEERRREMPFVSRWFDVRRYNNNETPADDVVMTRTFYPYTSGSVLGSEQPITYTLEKDSRRYARPIPETDVIASEGVLKQNQY